MSPNELGPSPPDAPATGRHDEMFDPTGAVRPVWSRVHDALLRTDEASRRRDVHRIQRRLHSHGASFGRPDGTTGAWSLDPIPMVVERSEWGALGRALVQRARVLEAVLADVFGEQRLLRSGLLPIDAVVSHRDYLRPCIGVPPGGGRHLVLYAADVTRSPTGGFTVVSDRTQAPSGAGYALENREVLSSTYPELVRASGAEPLGPWFSAVRLGLAAMAPPGTDDPRVVILTPGPRSETYFEHGFLSRSLGYTLVEPADLTVRDGHVWLKSVVGLEPVHVILRRVDAEWCDSLELREDSLLGVPGLVEAARRRNVSIVNPLGSGLAENPALLPYLGELTRVLLGEEPLVETAPTWWCGEPSGRSHVLSNLDRLVVKAIDRGAGTRAVFCRELDRAALDDLRRRIVARPHLFVGQEELELSTAPADDGGRVVAHHALLRSFLVAEADGFAWMDGGLTRTSAQPRTVSSTAGGVSKDTWVVAVPTEHSWTSRRPLHLPQVDLRDSLTSSAAESMYWIGRNLERAECVVRLVRAIERTLGLWPELRDESGGAWLATMHTTLEAVVGEPDRDEDPDPGHLRAPVGAPQDGDLPTDALVDARRPQSLVTSLRYLVRGGRSVGELFTTDSWRMLSELEVATDRLQRSGTRHLDVGGVLDDPAHGVEPASEVAESIMAPLAALSGLIGESMVRDPGWRFLDLGRRIERSQLLARILRASLSRRPPEPIAAPLHETLLAAWECLAVYRRRHRSDVDPATMFALLLTDRDSPRSLRYQADRLADDLAGLPAMPSDPDGVGVRVAELVARLERLDVASLTRVDHAGQHVALGAELDELDALFAAIAELTELGWFAQVGLSTLGGTSGWEPVQ